MTYAKAVEKYEQAMGPADDRLCAEPGCRKPWTIIWCDRRMCREHYKAGEHRSTPPPEGWAAELKARLRNDA